MAGIEQLQEIKEAGSHTVNGREYEFNQMQFKQAKKVFAYFTEVANDLEAGRLGFIDTKRFEEIEKILWDNVLFDGMQISKMPHHWGTYTQDYMEVVSVSLGVFSVPFLPESPTNSESESAEPVKTISRKPM